MRTNAGTREKARAVGSVENICEQKFSSPNVPKVGHNFTMSQAICNEMPTCGAVEFGRGSIWAAPYNCAVYPEKGDARASYLCFPIWCDVR